MNRDMLHTVLIPLLHHIGIPLPPNPLDKILYTTPLETSLLRLQLGMKERFIPSYIENENRCILHNIGVVGNTILQRSVYFQFKESYDLKLYNGRRCFVPKVISMEENQCVMDSDYIQKNLYHLVFEQILNTQNFNDIIIQSEYIENLTVAEQIIDELLRLTVVSVNNHLVRK